jgi:hypothetical protein
LSPSLRIGLKGKNWGFGISAKAQDGIGSKWQKQYKIMLVWTLCLGKKRKKGARRNLRYPNRGTKEQKQENQGDTA